MENLHDVRYGLLLSLLTLLFGFGLGGVFGAAEDNLKGSLKSSGEAVITDVYKGDTAKMNAIVSKSWSYFKRAHLHANGLGTSALVMLVLLAMLHVKSSTKLYVSLMAGIGSLGYSVFWLIAGIRAPGLGSTGLAKESLSWLAIPTSAMCIITVVVMIYFVVSTLFVKK